MILIQRSWCIPTSAPKVFKDINFLRFRLLFQAVGISLSKNTLHMSHNIWRVCIANGSNKASLIYAYPFFWRFKSTTLSYPNRWDWCYFKAAQCSTVLHTCLQFAILGEYKGEHHYTPRLLTHKHIYFKPHVNYIRNSHRLHVLKQNTSSVTLDISDSHIQHQ